MNGDQIASIALANAHHGSSLNDLYMASVVMGAIALVALGVPALVMHYRLRARQLAAVEAQDLGSTKGLWDTARRMEERIGYLETVLDTEVPGWRNRSDRR